MNDIRPANRGDIAKLLTLGAIWGSTFTWTEVALVELPGVHVATVRLAIGALALTGLAWAMRARFPRGGRNWALITLIGFFNASLPFSLGATAQETLTASQSAILIGAGPFAALALNHFFTGDDRISLRKAIGVLVGFSGIAVLVGRDALAGTTDAVVAQLMLIGVSVSYALSSLMTRWVRAPSSTGLSAAILLTSMIYMVPLAFLMAPLPATAPGWSTWGALLLLGLLPTGLAQAVRVSLIRSVGAVFASQVSYLVPVFGVFWGWLLLAEEPELAAYLALTLVLLGLAISRQGGRRRHFPVTSEH